MLVLLVSAALAAPGAQGAATRLARGDAPPAVRPELVRALAADAELLVVYYGHNEVAQFTWWALAGGGSPALLGLRLGLHGSALYAATWDLLGRRPRGVRVTPRSDDPPDRTEINALSALALESFRANIGGLLDAAADRHVPVILVKVATNYRFARLEPFAGPGPGSWDDLDRLLAEAEAASAGGRFEEARERWQRAIDRSSSPREATSGILRATEDLASDRDCTLVDAARLFYARSPDGLTVSGLFWDDLHPSRAGHALIALALEPVVAGFVEAAP